MNWNKDDTLIVVDLADNKNRKCKVKEIDNDNSLLLIHFEGYNARYDEWIAFNSDRIVSDIEENTDKSEPDDDIKAALEELAMIDEVSYSKGHPTLLSQPEPPC